MGSLWNFELSPSFVTRFPIFVETGYGTGNGLEYAVQHNFERIFSIEVWDEAVRHGRNKFRKDNRVEIIQAWSRDGIVDVLTRIRTNGIFFWLDAHFPGADCFNEPFDTFDIVSRLPIRSELAGIEAFKPDGNYTILIDDLRYYGNLPWAQEWTPEHHEVMAALPEVLSLDFLGPFTETHSVQILLNDKGYALISPFDAPQIRFKQNV